MDFTDQQRNAITNHAHNLIVVAGAGSGKTRVLVERYLALLEANRDWPLDSLVAITFTKKAAGEMRDRVRKGLENRYNAATTPADAAHWSRLLGEMDSARIDTIHGLCADILRANAAEAGLDPDFVVLDETEGRIILEDVADRTLAALAESPDDPLTQLLAEYDGQKIRAALADAALIALDIEPLPDNLLARWQALWAQDTQVQLRQFMQIVETIGTFTPPPDDKIGESWRICLAALDHIVDSGYDVTTSFAALNDIASVGMRGGSPKNWGDDATFQAAKDSLKQIRQEAVNTRQQIGDPPGELDQQAAHLLSLWVDLIRRVQDAYLEAKASQSLVDFDDLERMTRDLLLNNPAVQARYRGEAFRHVLVDEFQDTNQAQWQIIQALTGLDQPGSMFVVGDPKQSIYAFRGADVSVFGAVQAQITDRGGQVCSLSQSFRTHRPLVDGFNALFDHLLIKEPGNPAQDYQVEAEAMEAFREHPPDQHPMFNLLLIDSSEHDTEECRRWEAYEIAQRIHAMIDSGCQVYDREQNGLRTMRFDDVAILFQSLSNVNLYEDVFKAAGLPFVTIAGRGYYNRQEVWDLINLLQALYNPEDDLALASVLRSPMFGFSDDALFALRLPVEDEQGQAVIPPLWKALHSPGELFPSDEINQLDFAHDCLAYLRTIAGRVTISELLREALDRTGYLAMLTGLPDGARRRGNVEKLVDMAQANGKVTFGAFSQYLQELSAHEVREGEALVDVTGAVQIMSVHASKGLEFPLVVLADASWVRRNSDRQVLMADPDGGLACKVYEPEAGASYAKPYHYRRAEWIYSLREQAERLRLLYVAMTRAQDYLLVSGQLKSKKETPWYADGWLGCLLDVFDIYETLAPGCDDVYPFASGQMRVTIPLEYPPEEALTTRQIPDSAWDSAPPAVQPQAPLLLQALDNRTEMQIRHLAATHLSDLGSAHMADEAHEKKFYRERFRRQVLQDAPAVVEWVSQDKQTVTGWQVGEMVHESLRHWRIPDGTNDTAIRAMLRSYAWRQGITDEENNTKAVGRAFDLLQSFKGSDVFKWVNAAAIVYREMPFIYERNGYVIHGIIDTVLQMPDGRWLIVDYKTSHVNPPTLAMMRGHLRRYYLQLGIYAEAVEAQLSNVVPETYIHYIRYMRTIPVYEAQWRPALSRKLTDHIVEVLS